MADAAPTQLRSIDDDTLLEMYDEARVEEDGESCDAISAELIWRGIEVSPCGANIPLDSEK